MRGFFLFVLFWGYSAFGSSLHLNLLSPPDIEALVQEQRNLQLLSTRTPNQEYEELLIDFKLAEGYAKEKFIHAEQSKLKDIEGYCESSLEKAFDQFQGVIRTQVIYLCWINEAEMINYLSATGAYSASQRLDNYSKLALEAVPSLTQEEKWYAEGRIYSSLPKLYGQNFKKALVALQMLKRLKHSTVADLWIDHIRLLQGNRDAEVEQEFPLSWEEKRRITDGRNFGIFPMAYGSTSQGLGLQLRILDDSLFDTNRSVRVRVYGTHRGSVALESRYVDRASLSDTTLVATAHLLYGIQEFHGIGIHSGKDSTDIFHTAGRVSLFASKRIQGPFYFNLGWRLLSAHLRHVENGPFLAVPVRGSANTFESGAIAEIGYDTRDSEVDSYLGRLVYLRGHFPVSGILSSESYQKWWGAWDEYIKLGLRYTLRVSASLIDSSSNTPYWDYALLSGSSGVPGVSLGRFQEHDLLAAWTELRVREWDPFTVFCFFNLATVAPDFSSLFKETFKAGLGLGLEAKLTRFRPRAVRAEIGTFGSEFVFKASVGIPIE